MTTHDGEVLAQVGVQTISFVAGAASLADGDVAAPSALPGWTRGHVLSHVANQADALTGVILAAGRDEVASMYPSRAARESMIEAGATRPAQVHVERLLSSAERLATAWQELPDDRIDVQFTAPAGWFRPVSDAMWFRWRELVLHAVDLGVRPLALRNAGPLVGRLLDEAASDFQSRSGVPGLTLTATDSGRHWVLGDGSRQVSGDSAALAGWLTGRSDGSDLTAAEPLPALPPWL